MHAAYSAIIEVLHMVLLNLGVEKLSITSSAVLETRLTNKMCCFIL